MTELAHPLSPSLKEKSRYRNENQILVNFMSNGSAPMVYNLENKMETPLQLDQAGLPTAGSGEEYVSSSVYDRRGQYIIVGTTRVIESPHSLLFPSSFTESKGFRAGCLSTTLKH